MTKGRLQVVARIVARQDKINEVQSILTGLQSARVRDREGEGVALALNRTRQAAAECVRGELHRHRNKAPPTRSVLGHLNIPKVSSHLNLKE